LRDDKTIRIWRFIFSNNGFRKKADTAENIMLKYLTFQYNFNDFDNSG